MCFFGEHILKPFGVLLNHHMGKFLCINFNDSWHWLLCIQVLAQNWAQISKNCLHFHLFHCICSPFVCLLTLPVILTTDGKIYKKCLHKQIHSNSLSMLTLQHYQIISLFLGCCLWRCQCHGSLNFILQTKPHMWGLSTTKGFMTVHQAQQYRVGHNSYAPPVTL